MILKLFTGNNPYIVVLEDRLKPPVNLLLKPSFSIPLSLYLKIHPSFRLSEGFIFNQLKSFIGIEKLILWIKLLSYLKVS